MNTYATLKIKGTGTTVAGIKQEQLLGYVIGLPPLTEQRHIVIKVGDLMNHCNKLKIELASQKVTQQYLADAFVKKALVDEN